MKPSTSITLLALFGALFLSSCASPGIKELSRSAFDSSLTAAFIDPQKLTPETEGELAQRELLASYRKNPELAISTFRSQLDESPSPAEVIALAELLSNSGESLALSAPLKAAGYYLASAELTLPLALNAQHEVALEAYNHSCHRFVTLLYEGGHDFTQPQPIQGPGRSWTLNAYHGGDGLLPMNQADEVWVANRLKLKGFDDLPRKLRPGFGAAMVGHRNGTPEHRAVSPFLSPQGMSNPATVTLDFLEGGKVVELAIHDSMMREEAILGGQSVPLHADFTAPLATLYKYRPNHNVGWRGMLHPDSGKADMGIFEIEPHRPDQIPLVFVHGLMSNPGTWLHALNELRADPILRSRYQVLAFYYPTGYPIPQNAAALRQALQKYQRTYDPNRTNPNMRNMILVGHSMGGILSNIQIRDSQDSFTKLLFKTPLDEVTTFTEEQKEQIAAMTIYEANPDITRAVFIAAPHRGSQFADSPIGKLGDSLIKIPNSMAPSSLSSSSSNELTELGYSLLEYPPNSITDLQANSLPLMTILDQPVREGTIMHSIIGVQKGRKPLEESGDGVVPYWSSHMEGAASEKTVNASHTTITGNPDAIEELRRILYLHAGANQ